MFQVKGMNNFQRHFSNRNFLCDFFFLSFDCLILPKIFCFNWLKIRLYFVFKKNLNTFFWLYKNMTLRALIYFCWYYLFCFFQKNSFRFFLQRTYLVTRTVSKIGQFSSICNKTNHPLIFKVLNTLTTHK